MADSVIAAQLYTLREFLKTPEEIVQTMKKVRKIGYEAVQLSGLGTIDPGQLKEIVDSEGLTVCATHISFQRLCDELEQVMQEHKLWNCKYVGIGGMPAEYRDSSEGFARFASEASVIGRKLADNGFKFIYHNHAFEFTKFDGVTGMDILLEKSDPEAFGFEIDTYWVQHGGGDPAEWIRKVKGRMDVVHFKDREVVKNEPVMAEVGEGNLNWKAIIQACRDTDVKWYCVEQDVCRRDPFDSLAISLRNLKSMGLK
jgi:sugar phosphate isomerase/epimerase